MGGYLLRRLLSILPTLLGITLVTFLLLEALPGREVALLGVQERGLPSAGALAEVRRAYHLDEPIGRRYLEWVLRVARWDLGESVLDSRPVCPGSVTGRSTRPTRGARDGAAARCWTGGRTTR